MKPGGKLADELDLILQRADRAYNLNDYESAELNYARYLSAVVSQDMRVLGLWAYAAKQVPIFRARKWCAENPTNEFLRLSLVRRLTEDNLYEQAMEAASEALSAALSPTMRHHFHVARFTAAISAPAESTQLEQDFVVLWNRYSDGNKTEVLQSGVVRSLCRMQSVSGMPALLRIATRIQLDRPDLAAVLRSHAETIRLLDWRRPRERSGG